MSKHVTLKLALSIITFAVSASFASGAAYAKDVIHLAFIGPLSGGNASNGIGGRNSAELAVKQHNNSGKSPYEYKLDAFDTECTPNVGVRIATRVATNQQYKAAIAHYCSAVAVATVDLYHKFNLPVVIWAAVEPSIIYGNDYKQIFRPGGSLLDEDRTTVAFLKEHDYHRIAIINDTTAYGVGHLKAIQDYMKSDGIANDVVGIFGVDPNQKDLSSLVLQIKQLNPDLVLVAGLTPLAIRVKLAIDQNNMEEVQYFVVSGSMTTTYIDTVGQKSAEGTISSHNMPPLDANSAIKQFADAYRAAGYKEPPEAYGPDAYASTQLILDAIDKVGPNRDKIIDTLSKTKDRPSVIGHITFNAHGGNPHPSTIYTVKDGRWQMMRQ